MGVLAKPWNRFLTSRGGKNQASNFATLHPFSPMVHSIKKSKRSKIKVAEISWCFLRVCTQKQFEKSESFRFSIAKRMSNQMITKDVAIFVEIYFSEPRLAERIESREGWIYEILAHTAPYEGQQLFDLQNSLEFFWVLRSSSVPRWFFVRSLTILVLLRPYAERWF